MDLRRSKSVPTPPRRHQPPEVLLGRYEFGRLLGRGTFAKVYYARSLADGSGVAVKVLDKPEVLGTGMAPRVLREVSAMRRLSHPNILKLHEVMATKSKIYLVMEHAAGGDLHSLVARRGRLPEPVARRYFQQLVSAMRYCHARGVTHRDVKPQNLLLDRHGNLKVSDFGLSALPDQLLNDGRLHTACGTPAYTAPEVVRRKGYDGAKADAWSCGVILFVLLAGSLPFDDANLANMYRKIHRREYEFPSWISGSARRLVARLLDPNPETRMTIEALADHPWFKRSLSLDSQLSLMDLPPRDGAAAWAATTMNAFDIISLSSGLDLSGLFDDRKKREKRFTSTASVQTIMRRIEEMGAKLGYLVEWRKEGAVGLRRWGSVVLVVEVSEVVSPLLLVELRVDDGSTGEVEEFGWEELKAELGDIVFAWQSSEDS
ncbi:CBL-interacting protein kinase 4-like [Phoenix dactylifera]|uniref:non-specific serine/threonine protein kinase n=1 Tax=Phoenix dactylifera TaxID=42345 RepID=A0A8B7BGU9_PHODC|nr:CBL-interacting protein kinase 4-like [Phoenix dactylifera]